MNVRVILYRNKKDFIFETSQSEIDEQFSKLNLLAEDEAFIDALIEDNTFFQNEVSGFAVANMRYNCYLFTRARLAKLIDDWHVLYPDCESAENKTTIQKFESKLKKDERVATAKAAKEKEAREEKERKKQERLAKKEVEEAEKAAAEAKVLKDAQEVQLQNARMQAASAKEEKLKLAKLEAIAEKEAEDLKNEVAAAKGLAATKGAAALPDDANDEIGLLALLSVNTKTLTDLSCSLKESKETEDQKLQAVKDATEAVKNATEEEKQKANDLEVKKKELIEGQAATQRAHDEKKALTKKHMQKALDELQAKLSNKNTSFEVVITSSWVTGSIVDVELPVVETAPGVLYFDAVNCSKGMHTPTHP